MHDDEVLSETQMKEVIDRAMREPPTSSGITVAEFRRIAAELDIDPVSFERALGEVIGLPVPGQPARSWFRRQLTKLGHLVDPFLPSKGRLVGGALFGAAAGWLNAFLMTFDMQGHYPVAIAMIGITAANLLSRRVDRKLPRFLAETYAMWGAYAALWAGTYGSVTENLVLWVGLWTSVAAIAGWLLMRTRPGDSAPPALPALRVRDATEASDDPLPISRARLLQRAIALSFVPRLSRA